MTQFDHQNFNFHKDGIGNMKKIKCVYCNKYLNAAQPLDDLDVMEPQDGDVSICVYCGELSEFYHDENQTLDMKFLTQEQKEQMFKELDPKIQQYSDTLRTNYLSNLLEREMTNLNENI